MMTITFHQLLRMCPAHPYDKLGTCKPRCVSPSAAFALNCAAVRRWPTVRMHCQGQESTTAHASPEACGDLSPSTPRTTQQHTCECNPSTCVSWFPVCVWWLHDMLHCATQVSIFFVCMHVNPAAYEIMRIEQTLTRGINV